jgi:hypothetical protein
MSKKTAGKLGLIFGLVTIAWSAWSGPAVTTAPEAGNSSVIPSTKINGFAAWVPSSLAKIMKPLMPSSMASTLGLGAAAPMSADEIASANPNPDSPPAADSAEQEAIQAASLAQSGAETFPLNAVSPVSSRPYSQLSSAPADPASDPSANVPLVQMSPAEKKSSGHSSLSSSSTSSAFTGLKNEDYVALLSPLKASFEDRMAESFGSVCVLETQVCAEPGKTSVHSLRWSQEEGLNRHVGFTIKSIGPALQFDLSLKIQKSTTSEETVALSLSPLSIDAQTETVNGKSLRVINFRFADFQIRGETMTNVHAQMMFESTDAGLVPTAESRFEFSRLKATIAVAKWEPEAVVTASTDPTQPTFPDVQNQPVWVEEENGRKPSSESGSYFLADELLFSIKVEKS